VEDVKSTLAVLRNLWREGKAELYYTPFNMVEIIGKLSKLKYDKDRVSSGLLSITERFNLVYPTVEGYLKALTLRALGHKDLIDLLLYTTSVTRGLIFLTRDEELIDFLRGAGESIRNIIRERELLSI